MTAGRSYGEGCAMAHALDLVGERWALLVVRELLLGPKRFSDLRGGVRNAGANVLSQRLRELTAAGVVSRRRLPAPAASTVYELTGWGRELEAVVIALGRWGARSPRLPVELGMSHDSHLIAMRTTFDPAAAGDLRATLELWLGDDHYLVRIADGRIEARRGGPVPVGAEPVGAEPVDAVLHTDPGTLAGLVWGGQEIEDAARDGSLTVTGDRRLATRVLGLFPLPEAARAGTS